MPKYRVLIQVVKVTRKTVELEAGSRADAAYGALVKVIDDDSGHRWKTVNKTGPAVLGVENI